MTKGVLGMFSIWRASKIHESLHKIMSKGFCWPQVWDISKCLHFHDFLARSVMCAVSVCRYSILRSMEVWCLWIFVMAFFVFTEPPISSLRFFLMEPNSKGVLSITKHFARNVSSQDPWLWAETDSHSEGFHSEGDAETGDLFAEGRWKDESQNTF